MAVSTNVEEVEGLAGKTKVEQVEGDQVEVKEEAIARAPRDSESRAGGRA